LPAIFLAAGSVALWFGTGPNPVSSRVLDIPDAVSGRLAQSTSIALTARGGVFSPRTAVLAAGGWATFVNERSSPLIIRFAARSPSPGSFEIRGYGRASLRLDRPGLYHYYDALTARPLHVVANNQVLVSRHGLASPREGWIAVVPGVPRLAANLTVPRGQDLFAPKALVTVVGSTITVANHDADAHNFVVDPASPAGAAFMIDGTDDEPPSGWKRLLVVQSAGLYHVYCTMHTRVVGVVDGWHVVVPRPTASGYRDHNPMEAWIVVLPATTTD
jgi:plastocyanin